LARAEQQSAILGWTDADDRYRRDDSGSGFLERWLALFRTELGDWERTLEELPRQFDARTVAAADLPMLSAWLALALPSRLDVAEQRRLLANAHARFVAFRRTAR